jgi:hypothetical protein
MSLEETPVWIGQVNRDFAQPMFSFKDHIIDLDEDGIFFLQNQWYFQGLRKYGYVKGVGAATYSEPRGNLTGDPYFTDGNRAVLLVSSRPVAFSDVGWIHWEIPPDR